MPETVKLFINEFEVEVEEGKTILEAAKKVDVYIPTICYHPDLPSPNKIKSIEAVYRGNKKIVNGSSEKEFEG
ncbi:(2Fe-2S)-binding protein, partial [Candidatus Bathyarchaeota archaeon]|nr:(2Fe-2S)-binding protein [Candidatus Bathyarchaeota archaeon]